MGLTLKRPRGVQSRQVDGPAERRLLLYCLSGKPQKILRTALPKVQKLDLSHARTRRKKNCHWVELQGSEGQHHRGHSRAWAVPHRCKGQMDSLAEAPLYNLELWARSSAVLETVRMGHPHPFWLHRKQSQIRFRQKNILRQRQHSQTRSVQSRRRLRLCTDQQPRRQTLRNNDILLKPQRTHHSTPLSHSRPLGNFPRRRSHLQVSRRSFRLCLLA